MRQTFGRASPISQYATVPRAFVFIQRINLGLYALLGELGATGRAGAAGLRGAAAGVASAFFTDRIALLGAAPAGAPASG